MVNTYSLTVEEYFWFRCAFLDVEGDCFESLHHRNQVLQTQELWSLKQRQTKTIRDDITNRDTHAHVTQYMYCLTRNFGGRKFWQNARIACWILFWQKAMLYTLQMILTMHGTLPPMQVHVYTTLCVSFLLVWVVEGTGNIRWLL